MRRAFKPLPLVAVATLLTLAGCESGHPAVAVVADFSRSVAAGAVDEAEAMLVNGGLNELADYLRPGETLEAVGELSEIDETTVRQTVRVPGRPTLTLELRRGAGGDWLIDVAAGLEAGRGAALDAALRHLH